MSKNTLSNSQSQLCEVFGFSHEDMVSNQNGLISNDQKMRMKAKQSENEKLAWFGYGFVAGIGLLGVVVTVIKNSEVSINFLWAYLALAAFAAVIIWALFFRHKRKMIATLREGGLHSVKGPIRFISERPGNKTVWFIRVNGVDFEIDNRQHYSLNKAEVAGKQAEMFISKPYKSLLSLVLR